MKHIEPPENLPVVPEIPTATEDEPSSKDVHFRDREEERTLRPTPTEDVATGGDSVPASRSLQPINSDMTQRKERPVRAPDDLLSVDDVAARLLVSRAAVYRLVAHRRLPVYRLPGGFRFKVEDVDAFLEAVRAEAKPPKKYGSAKDQG